MEVHVAVGCRRYKSIKGHSDMPRNENEEIKQEYGRAREETAACVRHMATVTALGPDALVTLSMSKKAVL